MLQKETAQQTQQQVVQVWGIGTDGKISDLHMIPIVWLLMIGDFQSKGHFPHVPRHPPTPEQGTRRVDRSASYDLLVS